MNNENIQAVTVVATEHLSEDILNVLALICDAPVDVVIKESDSSRSLEWKVSKGYYDIMMFHLRRGKRIAAIKTVRACTGWGLKMSKEFCDEIYPIGSIAEINKITELRKVKEIQHDIHILTAGLDTGSRKMTLLKKLKAVKRELYDLNQVRS